MTELGVPLGLGTGHSDTQASSSPDHKPCTDFSHLELALVFLILAHCSSLSILLHTIYIKASADMWSALGDSCRISELWGLSEVSL